MPQSVAEPVVVLGLGRFGHSVAVALAREGCEVLAVDRDAELVRAISPRVTLAVEADVTSFEALAQLGVGEYTRAVVAIGDDVESSLVCALVLKEDFKIREVWAKATNAQQAKILRKIGVIGDHLSGAGGGPEGGALPPRASHRIRPDGRRARVRRVACSV